MASSSDLPKLLHIAVHGEEDALYRLVGRKGSEAVENYSPSRTYQLIRKVRLDRGIDYSSMGRFLESASENFASNGVPFSYSLDGDFLIFNIGCPLAREVHPAVPIRKCLVAKYFAALLFHFSERKGIGVPVLKDSKFTADGSRNEILFVKHTDIPGKSRKRSQEKG